MPFPRLYQHVHVVGHDAPVEEAVPIPIEVEKRIFDKLGNTGIAQVALPMPSILVLFDPTSKFLCLFALFGSGVGETKLLAPLLEERGGHTVVESKVDALEQPWPVEVWVIAAGVPALVVWQWA